MSSALASLAQTPQATATIKTTLRGHSGSIESISLSDDGEFLVTASMDKIAILWNLRTYKVIRRFVGHENWIYCCKISSNNTYVVTGSGDTNAKLWLAKTGEEIRSLEGHTFLIWCVDISSDNRYILTGSGDNTVKLWSLEDIVREEASEETKRWNIFDKIKRNKTKSCKAIRTFTGHSKYVRAVTFTKDAKYFVSGSYDKSVKLWDVEKGTMIKTYTGHTESVRCVEISSDNQYIVTGSKDNVAIMWKFQSEGDDSKETDKDKGMIKQQFTGHTGGIKGVCISPDNKYILTAAGDKTVKLWDCETGENVNTLNGHNAAVTGVTLTPDNQTLVTSSYDQTAIIWDLTTLTEQGEQPETSSEEVQSKTTEITTVLEELRLGHHENAFLKEGIDSVEDLKLLKPDDLTAIGVTKIGERNRINAWIAHRSSPQNETAD